MRHLILVSIFLLPLLDAVAQPLFRDLPARRTGIDFRNDVRDTPAQNILIYSNFYGGGGVGVGDFDRDGRPDLFFAGNLVADALYRNLGDFKFERRTDDGITEDDGWSSGVVVADANHDGWPDIYVTRELYDDEPHRRRNRFYLNRGDGTFREVAARAGIDDPARSRHATFFDYDGDGDLDLYVLNQPPNPGNYSPLKGTDLTLPQYRSRLYRNEGNDDDGVPRFTPAGSGTGIEEVGFPNSVIAADFDLDGRSDLYVTHDYEAPDRLYHNNGDGTFTEEIHAATGHTSYYSMGVDAADLNHDGRPDLMVLDMVAEDNYRLKANMSGMNPEAFAAVVKAGGHYQYMYNSLQLNRDGRQFSEVAQLAGVAATDWSWSNLFADFDNDGFPDLHVTNGLLRDIRNTDAAQAFATYVTGKINAYIAAHPDDADVTIYDVIDLNEALSYIPSVPLSNYAFRGGADLKFTNATRAWGLDRKGFSSGSAYADLNGDGRLDLIVNNLNAPASIYQNDGEQGRFLRLQLVDPDHRSTFGTRARINGRSFFTTNVRGMYSTSEDILHVGLGDDALAGAPAGGAGAVDVELTWPDGTVQTLHQVPVGQQLTVTKASKDLVKPDPTPATDPYLTIVPDAEQILHYRHRENIFDDYRAQVLLPHRQSRNGPAAAVADVNSDGRDDLFLGGASGQSGGIWLHRADGSFAPTSEATFRATSLLEDVGAEFFDADGDGDADLYVAGGGNEWPAGSPFYRDRLYLNDGSGNFTEAPPETLPGGPAISSGPVTSADFDGDGDLDLFVGGRLVPQDYPAPASSRLLRNDGSTFTDVTDEFAPDLRAIGLITSAVWSDLDGDARPDLLLAGEWTDLIYLRNTGGGFRRETDFTDSKTPLTGWWFSVTKGDLDGDGDDDFIFGNLGNNYKYRADPSAPFEVYYDDFDGNGRQDIVLSYHQDGELFPLRGRSCSSEQIPTLKESFPTYDAFAAASLEDVIPVSDLREALHLKAHTFSSMVGYNDGGRLRMEVLPIAAQISPVRAALIRDFDGDGAADIYLHGNLYEAEIETPRADGGMGQLLLQDGAAGFRAAEGFPLIRKNVRHLLPVGVDRLLLIPNDDEPVMLKVRR